jgi:hypothetical protein
MILNWFSTLKLTKVRLWSILVTLLYLSLLTLSQHKRFISDDKAPVLYSVDEKTKKLASTVYVGMHINSFPQFSFDDGFFTIDATVWFRYPAASESLDTLEQFTLYNSLIQQNGKLLYRSDPIIKLIGDEVLVCYHIQTTFKLTVNHKHFPIGDHTLHLLLQNKSVTPNELCFIADPQSFSLSENVLINNWLLKGVRAETGYIKSKLYIQPASEISYPAVLFSLDFERVGFRHIGALFLPMLIIFLIGLLSLLLGIDDSNRLTLITGAAPSLVLFRLVINAESPVAGYVMHVDFVFYTFVLLLLIILLFQLYVALALNRAKLFASDIQEHIKAKLEQVSDVVFLSNLALLTVLITYSFFR